MHGTDKRRGVVAGGSVQGRWLARAVAGCAGLLAASSSAWSQTCVDQIIYDVNSQLGPVYQFHNTPLASVYDIFVDIDAQPDPARPWINSDPANERHSTGTIVPRTVGGGACNYWYVNLNMVKHNTNPVAAEWPNNTLAMSNGYYRLRVTCQRAGGIQRSKEMHAWVVDGVWTTDAPSSEGPPTYEDDPGNPADPGILKVKVFIGGTAPNGVTVKLLTPYGQTQNGTVNGIAAFSNLTPATYTAKVQETFNGVALNGQANVYVPAGGNVTLQMNFAANGAYEGSVGGSAGDGVLATQGFWADLMKFLWVPKQSTLDSLKGLKDQFMNWGPFPAMTQIANWNNLTLEDPAIGFRFPLPGADGSYATGPIEYTETIDFTAALHQVNDSMASEPESATWLGRLRTLMGLSVVIGFAMFVIKSFMLKPRL